MQIANNYQANYQPKFGKIEIMKPLKNAIKNGEVNQKRLSYINKFTEKYADSKVTVLLDKTDLVGDRLDAQIFYGKLGEDVYSKTYEWLAEKKYLNLFGLGSKEFFCRLSRKVHHIEKNFVPKNS